MGREVGGNWEECGGNCNKDIYYEKINLFSIKHNNKIKLT